MCCNGLSLAPGANEPKADHIDESLVATPLPDGYWIEAFPFSKNDEFPDLVAYGLGFQDKPASVRLFSNPCNTRSEGWKVNEIARLDFPVGMAYADLTGNGFNDIVICDRYGPNMNNLWDAETQNGGRILWLKNPGDRNAQPFWESHQVGNSTGMHRLRVGHFTTARHFQVMGLPIIYRSGDLTSPAPILIFTPVYGKDSSQGPQSWTKEIAFASEFRLIHDAILLPRTNDDLDMVLVSGREGVALLWFDMQRKVWEYNIVGTGLPPSPGNPYWGSGSVDVARVGYDDVGYIATCEGFHGNSVAVYLKDPKAPKGAASLKDSCYWRRVVVDNFGPLDPEQHTGTIHNVAAVQVGKVPNQSFAIACMGAPIGEAKNQGIYLYTPTDLVTGDFKKTKITDESAARLAIARFSSSSLLPVLTPSQEIASISYYVPGYHIGPDPPNVRINTFGTQSLEITAERLNKEVLLRIPRPSALPVGQQRTLSFWVLAGKKITVVVLPPRDSFHLGPKDAVKVIYGTLAFKCSEKEITRGIAPPAKTTQTTLVSGPVTAGDKGAVFLRVEVLSDYFQGPFSTMSEVTSLNIMPNTPHIPPNVRAMQFPFVKVETLEWASSGLWNHFEFYNVTGFYVYFNDDAFENVVHIQAWTLGLGETARFHNHSDKSFCEIHYCLSNGGGRGGMRFFPDNYADPIDVKKELTKEYVENSTLLVVPDMHEHGPLWKIRQGTRATPELRPNDTVDYPWHAWLASRFGGWPLPIKPPLPSDVQKFDVWMAFEFPSSAFQY